MCDPSAIKDQFLKNQKNFFRLAAKAGFTQKIISLDTDYSTTAINQWARGTTAMGGPAMLAIISIKDIPAELISVLIDGTDRHIDDGEDDHGGLDALGDDADDVAREVRRARSPDSPGGTEIIQQESARILKMAARLRKRPEIAA